MNNNVHVELICWPNKQILNEIYSIQDDVQCYEEKIKQGREHEEHGRPAQGKYSFK